MVQEFSWKGMDKDQKDHLVDWVGTKVKAKHGLGLNNVVPEDISLVANQLKPTFSFHQNCWDTGRIASKIILTQAPYKFISQ